MSSANPFLVLQLHRLGDLLLTFPLLRDLKRRYPENPVYVAAEPAFSDQLAPFAPWARFFGPGDLDRLAGGEYEAVINLSTSPGAAACAAGATSQVRLGPIRENGVTRIGGYWQLYRAALTQNNRHNVFHWADLNRLDLEMPPPPLPGPRPAPQTGRVGLFIGASEAAKRPGVEFWAALASDFAKNGLEPVLLGGPAEKADGATIAALAKAANFCGKTSVAGLARLMKTLDLCVAPDTGPMHLAAFLGVPVLNLSMGNVHAAETGPANPGHHILRASMSCVGCWSCQGRALACRQAFNPQDVGRVARRLLAGEHPDVPPGLELLRTGVDESGLHRLYPAGAPRQPHPSTRHALENFWQAAFLYFYDPGHTGRLEAASRELGASWPRLAASMRRNLGRMLAQASSSLRRGAPLPEDFWQTQPWHSRLFAGHCQMSLQNDDFSGQAWQAVLSRMAALQAYFAATI